MKTKHILLFFVLAFLTSCHKEQAILPNGLADCGCAEETSADFKIIESAVDVADYGLFSTETDTAYTNRNIYFIASQEDVEYKWYIGTEILTDSVVGRFFPNSAVQNQTIPITLVVKKKPNKICLPNDDGYDSIVKYIHFVKLPDNTGAFQSYPLNMVGTYRVKMPHLADSQNISISCFMDEYNLEQILSVSNYDGEGSNINIPSPFPSQGLKLHRKNYSEIQMGLPNNFLLNYFYGFLRRKVNTNQYEFDITFGGLNNSDPNYVKATYYGRKIN
ncbi:MAG: hypothetical protein ACK46Y_09505 [Fluviicola sp.]|jgi:hypothetical protein